MISRGAKQHGRKSCTARRLLVGAGAGAGVFLAAAAMATGSAVTAAPAHADFEDLIDPIIQPLLTSLTDSIAVVDPAAALDLTSWTDSLLASINSIDLALPAASEPAAAAASSAEPAAALSNVSIPINIAEDTEPTVGATVGGASTTLLVDSGSSGLVIPDTDFGSNIFSQLDGLFSLGLPTGFSESGYSGGVEYFYLTYNNVPVDYTSTAGQTIETTAPVEVEVYSYDPSDLSSLFTNDAFQNFDTSNEVTGILGVGTTGTGGAGESPIEAAGYQGVTVDLPGKVLTLDATPNMTGTELPATGSNVSLTESVDGGTPVAVSDDLDSGGVYGTIPSSLLTSSQIDTVNGTEIVAPGNTITLYDNGTPLYYYVTGTDSDGTLTGPTLTSGTSIDSGVIPFEKYPISIDYNNDDLYLQ